MESLHLKVWAPPADRRVVEEPVADLTVEPDDTEPTLEQHRIANPNAKRNEHQESTEHKDTVLY